MNDEIEEKEGGFLKDASMDYPTWNVIKELLDDDKFDNPEKTFGDKPIEKGNDPICSKIKGDIIEKYKESTPCGIDIPILLKPASNTSSDKPLIVILGESALRNKEELAEIKRDANVILGTPYAIHLEKCPPKCGVYRKIFDAILEKKYPIYLTDIIKVWSKDKKDSLLKPNDKDIEVFNKELDILKKVNNKIIIVAWGETAQNGLEKVRKDSKDVLPSLSLPHPGQRNWNAWKLRIFEKAVFSKNLEYATRLYGEDPNGDENKTTAEKVAGEAVQSIDDYISILGKKQILPK